MQCTATSVSRPRSTRSRNNGTSILHDGPQVTGFASYLPTGSWKLQYIAARCRQAREKGLKLSVLRNNDPLYLIRCSLTLPCQDSGYDCVIRTHTNMYALDLHLERLYKANVRHDLQAQIQDSTINDPPSIHNHLVVCSEPKVEIGAFIRAIFYIQHSLRLSKPSPTAH